MFKNWIAENLFCLNVSIISGWESLVNRRARANLWRMLHIKKQTPVHAAGVHFISGSSTPLVISHIRPWGLAESWVCGFTKSLKPGFKSNLRTRKKHVVGACHNTLWIPSSSVDFVMQQDARERQWSRLLHPDFASVQVLPDKWRQPSLNWNNYRLYIIYWILIMHKGNFLGKYSSLCAACPLTILCVFLYVSENKNSCA